MTRLRADYRRRVVSEAEARAFEELPDWTWKRNGPTYQDQEIQRRANDVATRWPHTLTDDDKHWLNLIRGRWDEDDKRALTRTQQNIMIRLLPGYLAMLPVAKFVDAANRWCKQHGQTITTMPQAAMVQLPGGRSHPVGKRAGYYRRRYLGKEVKVPLK